MNAKRSPESSLVMPSSLGAKVAQALTPIAPAPDRAAAMRDTLLRRARSGPTFVTVRSREGEWVPLAPDIAMKVLHDQGSMRAFLLRLDPGACLPAHDHPDDELCLVVEGDCVLGDVELGAGDYHHASAGSRHGDVRSRGGCVLFISLSRA